MTLRWNFETFSHHSKFYASDNVWGQDWSPRLVRVEGPSSATTGLEEARRVLSEATWSLRETLFFGA